MYEDIDFSAVRYTSLTMRSTLRRQLRDADTMLKESGVHLSEQRLMRECLRLALKFWRGRKHIAGRNRKYNKRIGPYEIVPFYTTEALRRVAHARCHHSGVSLSRLMDFAVANYLPRVIEYWLRFEYRNRDKSDAAAWREKYERRLNPSDFIISYEACTEKNNGAMLKYVETSEILPWPPP